MVRYMVRKLLLTIPMLIGMIVFLFVVFEFTPGNPADMALGEVATAEQVAALENAWGLDEPLYVRIPNYLINAVQGDLGLSFMTQRPVASEIARTIPRTMQLAFGGLVFAIILGIPLGVLASTKQGSIFDTATMITALAGLSVPVFVSGLVLIYLFSYKLGWFPVAGRQGFSSMILPAFALSLPSAAELARMTRSSMLDELAKDYLRTARAKGLSNYLVLTRHALKNAMIPILTLLGLRMGQLLTGTVVIETVFAWPGLGRLLLDAILFRDYPLIRSGLLVLALIFVLVNLLVDVLYAVIDPRIRYG